MPSVRFAINNVTGWDPTGMGSVEGYPASYLLIFARSAAAELAGPYATHLLYFATYSLVLVFGAARLVRVLGGPPAGAIAAALFAAFNPWTYTELVAGHGFMLFSYAATFWLLAECCARERSRVRLALLAIAVAPQVQYLLVDSLLYAWLSLRMRSWFALTAIGAMLLPVFTGILVTKNALLAIPLTVEWERGQSIAPLRAVVLRGYFTGYDAVLPGFYEWSLWAVVVIACTGVVAILAGERRRAWLIPATTIPLIWSFGLQGPIGGFFAWTIEHVAAAGVFRELYGLLGFVAVGYVAFCAIASARFGALAWLWLAAGLAMVVAWSVSPPERYWITHRALPATQINNAANTRFLLTPALYPARLGDRGSGTDPELYARADNVTPINEALPMYPLSPALGRYLRDGTTEGLGALSVTDVLARPWLQTDPSIRWQLALPLPAWLRTSGSASRSIAHATPELSIGALPVIATLASNTGAGNVLFADAREAQGPGVPAAWHAFGPIVPVRPGNVFVRAADGWVDARLAFVEDPELAQAYGGALTTNAAETLDVAPGEDALVFVRGRLSSPAGAALAAMTNGFRWVSIPSNVRTVRCSGLCVVAAQTARVPVAPLNPPVIPSEALSFRALVPWLIASSIPAGAEPLLRYNVTFDSKWTAIYRGLILPHVRIDGAVNGWLLPPRVSPSSIVLLETGAALITLSEIVSVAIVAGLLYTCSVVPARGGAARRRKVTRASRTDHTASNDSTT